MQVEFASFKQFDFYDLIEHEVEKVVAEKEAEPESDLPLFINPLIV